MFFAATPCTGRVLSSLVAVGVLSISLPSALSAAVELPPNDGYVTDAAKLMTQQQEMALEADLTQYAKTTSNEIAVVTLPNVEGGTIEQVALDIGRKWKIGSAENNNGIVVVVAYAERTIRIEVGRGLEGAVPDIVTAGVREQEMTPRFRDGDYYGGIVAGIDALKKHIGNEYTADRYSDDSGPGDIGTAGVFMLIVFGQWLLSILGRTKSWWLGGVLGGIGGLVLALMYGWWLTIPLLIPLGLFLDYIVSKNYGARGRTSWWAGGGWGPGGGGRFGGGGGGGFGGFGGGGGFSGGGSTGKW